MSTAGLIGDSTRRRRVPTEKGLEYNKDLKLRNIHYSFKAVKEKSERIQYVKGSNPDLEVMRNEYKAWMGMYEEFLQRHDEYYALLSDEERVSYRIKWYDERSNWLGNFKASMEEWFGIASSKRPNPPGSIVSRRSSQHSLAVSERLRSEQKRAELKARAASLRNVHQLELQKLSLRLKEEEMRLQTEVDVLEARSRVLDKFDSEAGSVFSDSLDIDRAPRARLASSLDGKVNAHTHVDVCAHIEDHRVHVQDKVPVYGDEVRVPDVNGKITNPYGMPTITTDLPQALVKQLQRPTPEMMKFGGDPMEYKKFMRQFQARVVRNTESDDERLYYLEQFTYGEAKKIVNGFSYLDAELGYQAALHELEERYGDTELIANAFIRKALAWPVIKDGNPKALDAFSIFLVECENAVRCVDSMKILEYSENMKKIVKRLPYSLHDKWRSLVQKTKENKQTVAFKLLVQFVKNEAKKANDPTYGKLALCGDDFGVQGPAQTKSRGRVSTATNLSDGQNLDGSILSSNKANSQTTRCLYCMNTSHSLMGCRKIETLTLQGRIHFLRSKGLCFGCLKPGHMKQHCRNKAVCKKCQGHHPSVLHVSGREGNAVDISKTIANNMEAPKTVAPNTDTSKTKSTTTQTQIDGSSSFADVYGSDTENTECDGDCTMAIVPVRVRMRNSIKEVVTYAFLDPGSNVSFCSSALMKEVCGTGHKMKITIETMGVPHTMYTYVVEGLEILSLDSLNITELPKVYTKDRMPVSHHHIPTASDVRHWPHFSDVHLPHVNADIGLLIGNNVPDAYTPRQVRTGPAGSPHATQTALGWIAWNVIRNDGSRSGKEDILAVNKATISAIQEVEDNRKLEKLVRECINYDFPERTIDDRKEWSQEDRRFMAVVEKSCRLKDGHYQISLPFRSDLNLPDNSEVAVRRLKGLEKRLRRDSKLHSDYNDFMSKIIQNGYAEIVPIKDLARADGKVWYIPHHGVYHPKKPDKVRVVFDCTCKYHGVSLNDLLLQGPNLTNNLIGVLLRFRQENVAIMGDIVSMFYQVHVPKDECDFLRFYWWPQGNLSIDPVIYRMTVHLFGAVSSPSCANFALRLTAQRNKNLFDPIVADTVLGNFYVDDCLKSVSSSDQAVSLIQQLTTLCEMGGFKLSKWVSNKREVLLSVPAAERAKEFENIELDYEKLSIERALGIRWSVVADTLGFKNVVPSRQPTRRNVLSIISSVYDPLGFAAPFILPAKILLQEMCRNNVQWDQELTGNDLARWQQWLNNLTNLDKLIIPRCFKPSIFGKVKSCQIHNFSDASNQGYGMVSYLRLEDVDGKIHCSLLIGKSRVAPLKKVTVPRMELTAAMLAVRVNKIIMDELSCQVHKVLFWTDSMSVLKWISNESAHFHTFVANRIHTIRESSESSQWRYVESKCNPADDASRGLDFRNLLQNQRWLKGPDFLWKSEDNWPKYDIQPQPILDNDPEVKTTANAVIVNGSSEIIKRLFSRYSTWMRLKIAVGWILRLKCKLREQAALKKRKLNNNHNQTQTQAENKKLQCNGNPISPEILETAEEAIIRYVQTKQFPDELNSLKEGELHGKLKKSSSIYKLNPFIKDGILRVGGRLEQASIPYEMKHPILLPKKHVVSNLLLEETHRLTGHLGKNAILARVRQKYWILGANEAIKRLTSKCVVCRKYQGKAGEQMMADLPEERLKPNMPPFSNIGMDYFGPLEVKRGRAVQKRYGVIFTCFTSRAVHLEVAHSLDTASCINAIRRFIARRGTPNMILSDNGTNLVGAERELREEISKWNQTKLTNTLSQKGIAWKFNPPHGSHFGGVWERLIRSVRKILYSLMHHQMHRFDDEGLHTLFCEVEATLNSRPITTVSDDPNDLQALTPNDLLLSKGKVLQPGIFSKDDNYPRRRWRQVQHLADLFWKRWTKEYLPTLQVRRKWINPRRNFAVGDIVLLMENTPRNTWALGRVLKVMTDRNGYVRVVEVKTATTVLQRPIDKLCLLLEADN